MGEEEIKFYATDTWRDCEILPGDFSGASELCPMSRLLSSWNRLPSRNWNRKVFPGVKLLVRNFTIQEFKLLFFKLLNVFLGLGLPHGCTGSFPRMEGARSSKTVVSSLRTGRWSWSEKLLNHMSTMYISAIFVSLENRFAKFTIWRLSQKTFVRGIIPKTNSLKQNSLYLAAL